MTVILALKDSRGREIDRIVTFLSLKRVTAFSVTELELRLSEVKKSSNQRILVIADHLASVQ